MAFGILACSQKGQILERSGGIGTWKGGSWGKRAAAETAFDGFLANGLTAEGAFLKAASAAITHGLALSDLSGGR